MKVIAIFSAILAVVASYQKLGRPNSDLYRNNGNYAYPEHYEEQMNYVHPSKNYIGGPATHSGQGYPAGPFNYDSQEGHEGPVASFGFTDHTGLSEYPGHYSGPNHAGSVDHANYWNHDGLAHNGGPPDYDYRPGSGDIHTDRDYGWITDHPGPAGHAGHGGPPDYGGPPGYDHPPDHGDPPYYDHPSGHGGPPGYDHPSGHGGPQGYDYTPGHGSRPGYGHPPGHGVPPGYDHTSGHGGPPGYYHPSDYENSDTWNMDHEGPPDFAAPPSHDDSRHHTGAYIGPKVRTWTAKELFDAINANPDDESMPYIKEAANQFLVALFTNYNWKNVLAAIPSPSGQDTWTLQELEQYSEIPAVSEEFRAALDHAHHLFIDLQQANPHVHIQTMPVVIGAVDISTWTMEELTRALQDPNTKPELKTRVQKALELQRRPTSDRDRISIVTRVGLIAGNPEYYELNIPPEVLPLLKDKAMYAYD